MEQRNYLVSDDVQFFFGNDYPSGDVILKTALRYIAIRRCGGDLEKLKPITVYSDHISGETTLIQAINTFNPQANILLLQCGQLPEGDMPIGWTKVENNVCKYLSQPSETLTTAIYVCEEHQRAFVFVTDKTSAWIKKLAQSLFQILLWHYPDRKLDKIEEKFFRSIGSEDNKTLNELIDDAAKTIDFRKERLRKGLTGWGTGSHEIRLDGLARDVEEIRKQVHQHQTTYFAALETLEEKNIQLTELRNAAPPLDEELFKFFNSHKNLSVVDISKVGGRNELWYAIDETIEFYDREEFIKIHKNPYGYMVNYSQEIRDLLFGLFADRKGRLRTKCVLKLTNYSSLTAERNYCQYEITVMPHPHIDTHACLGANQTPVAEYMRSGDWDLAIDQTIAAAKNVNFGDTSVIPKMINWLRSNLNSKHTFIIASNGTEMTIKQFLDYIKEEGENAE